jgi:hypothetical protein
MKKLFLLIVVSLFLFSCKKENLIHDQVKFEQEELIIDTICKWNMTDDHHVHYFTDTDKIKSIIVYVYNDSKSKEIDLLSSGAIAFKNGVICMYRTKGGMFDNSEFDDITKSRGVIHITKYK